jgi:quinol-cytochrome oxidoreductase complex cytochrome b subunit
MTKFKKQSDRLKKSYQNKFLANYNLYLTQIKSFFPVNTPRINKHYLISLLDSHIIHYPTPISLTYAWSFGSLAGLSLVIQMISGFFLSMHYTAHVDYAFNSIEYIMRDVPNGWFIRYVHANGASMFFMVVYAHICRGLYYGSYMKPRQYVWCSGVILFLLTMGAAFTGYVLPWGQMSFWGATVITNMVTILPGGRRIAEWLWGGYVIGNPTLRRFYSLHFVLPFLIAGLSLLHLILLHEVGSSSPIGSDTGVDDLPFYPYFVYKDLFAFSIYLFVFGYFVHYAPNFLNHPDNYIRADSIHTPAHVVPEWYFLPFYAILRSIPHKTGGILIMFASILILLVLPFYTNSIIRNTSFRPIFRIFFWFFVADVAILAWIGQKPVKDCYTETGRYATAGYFLFFLVLVPLADKLENFFNLHMLKLANRNKSDAALRNLIMSILRKD